MIETYVVDCSVAAKWTLREPGDAAALVLLDRYVNAEISLIAPDLLLSEFGSLLAKRHRRKDMTADETQLAFEFILRSAPQLFETPPLVGRALDLATRHQLS